MSFNDLERGTQPSSSSSSSRNPTINPSSEGRLPLYHQPPATNSNSQSQSQTESPEFKKSAQSLSIQIFKINSNVSGIEKLIQLNPNHGDFNGGDWSKQVADLTEVTRSLIKSSTSEIKSLSSQSSTSSNQKEKLSLQKLTRDFENALHSFQRVQKKGAEKSKDLLVNERDRERRMRKSINQATVGAKDAQGSLGRSSKKATQDNFDASSSTPLVDISSRPNSTAFPPDNQQLQEQEQEQRRGQQQQQQQQQQEQAQVQVQKPKGPSQAELEFQEALIEEREAEIREIEGGIHELNEIFRDLGQIVTEQGGMIDNIEYNVTSIATNTSAADRELVSASDYQRKAGRRAACLMLVVGFVIAVVLLALLN